MKDPTCWTKFDNWMWNSEAQSRDQKSENHVKSWCNDYVLACTRALSLVISVILLAMQISKMIKED